MTKRPRPPPPDEQKARVIQKGASIAQQRVGGDFVKVDSEERKQHLMRSMSYSRLPSTLWTKDRVLRKKFFVKRYIEYSGMVECEFSGRASKVMEEVDRELDSAGGNDIYFNLQCDESILFFRLRRREVRTREGILLIELPNELFEVQRRAQLRYRVSELDGYTADSSSFPPNIVSYRILDVSSGGVGILFQFGNQADAEAFSWKPKSRAIFRFNFGGLEISSRCEVRYLRRIDDELTGGLTVRVGVKMIGLSVDRAESVQDLVMERSYQRFKDMQTS